MSCRANLFQVQTLTKELKMTYSGVSAHKYFDNGMGKTVCTSYVLGALGVDPASYHYSAKSHQYQGVLRRNGYAVRSRASHTKKAGTVGQLRKLIQQGASKWGDPSCVKYTVHVVCGSGEHHLILLDRDGTTLVDTAPVKRDRRRVVKVQAVWRKTTRPQNNS